MKEIDNIGQWLTKETYKMVYVLAVSQKCCLILLLLALGDHSFFLLNRWVGNSAFIYDGWVMDKHKLRLKLKFNA
jgi:hypothetical protein